MGYIANAADRYGPKISRPRLDLVSVERRLASYTSRPQYIVNVQQREPCFRARH